MTDLNLEKLDPSKTKQDLVAVKYRFCLKICCPKREASLTMHDVAMTALTRQPKQ